jgi:GntR family transcriptional repressor for pyruvate dehydrogenase complex
VTAVFATIPKVDLADAVVDRVRDAILGDELEPGALLPSERDLAVQLGVNRTTVREGLARLEHLGLLDRRQGARCRVCDYRRTGSLELLPALARLGGKDVALSINEAAGIVYVGTVGLAATRATEADAAELARLAGAVEEAVAGGAVAEISEADRAFQHAVAASARSVALELMVSNFYRSMDHALDARGRVKRSTAQMLVELGRSGRALPHRRLAEAIAAGDVARAQAIASLVMTATGEQTSRRAKR